MKTQAELIAHFELQAEKIAKSHGIQSDYFMRAYFNLLAAKNGMGATEIFKFSESESERQKQIALDLI